MEKKNHATNSSIRYGLDNFINLKSSQLLETVYKLLRIYAVLCTRREIAIFQSVL